MQDLTTEPTITFNADSPQERAALRREVASVGERITRLGAEIDKYAAVLERNSPVPKTALQKLSAGIAHVFASRKFSNFGAAKPAEKKAAKPVDKQLLAATGSESLARFAASVKLPPAQSK
jgi:hypothetical protein